jgi:4-amino-4-deoxy-L-arabinose transferase-like glycosyltransferase
LTGSSNAQRAAPVLEALADVPKEVGPVRRPRNRYRARGEIATLVALMALAAALRLVYVGRTYDLWQDEVNYVDLGVSIRHGHFPPLFASQPFLLHPPLFFGLGAGWEMILQTSGDYFHVVATVRTLNIILAVISTSLLYSLGRRLGSRSTGIAAALLFACDPFVMRQNGRAMIETSTVMFVLAGYLLLLRLYQHRVRHPGLDAVVAGLLLGLSVVSKEMAAVLIVIPIGVGIWKRWGIERRAHVTVLVAAAIPYSIYLLMLVAVGQLGDFLSQQTGGIQRMLGLKKTTGFNRAGSPSLIHTLLAQLTGFGVTYLICGFGLLASLYVVKRARRDDQRLFALITFAGAGTLAYAAAFGTIEEQFLYLLYVPAILSLVIGATVFIQQRRTAGAAEKTSRHARRWVRGMAAFLALFVAYDLGLWVHTRSQPDNGIQRVVRFFQHQTRNPGVIGNDTPVTGYAEQRAGYQAVLIGSPATAAAARIRYVTILSVSVDGLYGSLNRSQARFYEAHGHMVYSFHDATYGSIRVYQTNDPSIW